MVVACTRTGDVMVVTIANPPVNALDAAVRRGLRDAFGTANADDGVAAVILCATGPTFCAGADIAELGRPAVDPALPVLVDLIEALTKPVIAAVHGTAMGGGCEIAMAAHYRIAVPSATFALPEVKLGLLPGAGGTQRLPRLVGTALALEMIGTGTTLSARRAHAAGLVDRLAREDFLEDDALAFAQAVAKVRPLPRTSERDVRDDPCAVASFESANARRFRGQAAPAAAIACVVRAARTPYPDGAAFERDQFRRLAASDQSEALRHLFFAERLAQKLPDITTDVPGRTIATVGIVGAGTMGVGVATTFLTAGLPVVLVDTGHDVLTQAVTAVRRNLERAAAQGRIHASSVEDALRRLMPSTHLEALNGADLVVEAVYEDRTVKRAAFAALDAICRPGAILATNSSYLAPDSVADATRRPQDVIGMHFFAPADRMKLVEVVRGTRTAADVTATIHRLAKRIGKIAVPAGACHGFIGNRMLRIRQEQAAHLLLAGVTPEAVDRAHTAFGMPMGPFRMADLAGLNIGWHGHPARIETIRDALVVEGRLGQKSGAGYYDYPDGRHAVPSPRVADIVSRFTGHRDVSRPAVPDADILERTLYPLVNEGVRILAEGHAARASDIDVVWVHGYGWPRHLGGPMFWAEREGLRRIVAGLDRRDVAVAPLLRDLADRGAGFAS